MPELIDKAKLLEYLAAIKPDEYVSAYGEAAADVINHVETYVSAMPTIEAEPVRHGRWLPVEDALPEYGEYVLFIRKNCEVYVGYYDEKNTWNTDYQWFCGENVTHWMPLPEPPEKE